MKRLSLFAAGAVVLVADAFALIHAARNRAGQSDADIVLTNQDLTYVKDPDNSGVTLNLRWLSPATPYNEAGLWSDRQMLRNLGFDCGVSPSDPRAAEFYARQLPRTAFVALEYNGPGWRSLPGAPETRLVAIDAAPDPATLRSRHSDRQSVIVVPAVFQIWFVPALPAMRDEPARAGHIVGSIRQLPSAIHVPKPFSEKFRGVASSPDGIYRVHLRYGSLREPWVTGVEIGPQ